MPCSMARRNGLPTPSMCAWPTYSSSDCGRMRAASGRKVFDWIPAFAGTTLALGFVDNIGILWCFKSKKCIRKISIRANIVKFDASIVA